MLSHFNACQFRLWKSQPPVFSRKAAPKKRLNISIPTKKLGFGYGSKPIAIIGWNNPPLPSYFRVPFCPVAIRRPDDGAAAPRPGAAAAAFRRLGTAGPPAGRAQGAGGGVVAPYCGHFYPEDMGKKRKTGGEESTLGIFGMIDVDTDEEEGWQIIFLVDKSGDSRDVFMPSW